MSRLYGPTKEKGIYIEAHYRAFNGRLVFKVEGTTMKDVIDQIGPIAEVFDGDDCCGKCQSPMIHPRSRVAQGFTFYELVCSACGAQLSFGQHKAGGTLWAKRTDDKGNPLDHRGWKQYLALEAPSGPPPEQRPASTPRPAAAQQPTDPRLADLLARAEKEGAGTVQAEMIAALDGFIGSEKADEVWNEAMNRHAPKGKQAIDPEVYPRVIAFLLARITACEQKRRQGVA